MKTKSTILFACILTLCLAAPAFAEYIQELNDTILKNYSYLIEDKVPYKFTNGEYCHSQSEINALVDCVENDPAKSSNCEQAKQFYGQDSCFYSICNIRYGKLIKPGYQVALVTIGDDIDKLFGGGTAIPFHIIAIQLVDGNISIAGKFTADRFNLKKMNLKKNKLELIYEEDKFFEKGQVRQNSAKKTITLDPRINY